MCNCRSEIEARLLERVRAQLPEEAKNLSVNLTGYVFLLGDGGVAMRNALPIEIEYEEPLKKRPGEFKQRRKKMHMNGNCCMFCGEKYDEAEDATS